jgi:flagellar motor switch/type III secretory pathway protein FliN
MNETDRSALGILGEVEVGITAQIGNARMPLASVLAMASGAVVPLDCAPDAPAMLIVNGVTVASGDIVVDDEGNLAIEIRELSR